MIGLKYDILINWHVLLRRWIYSNKEWSFARKTNLVTSHKALRVEK